MPKFSATVDSKYTFEIARIVEGNFKNLWRLRISTPEFTELVDADSLSTVISKIGYVLERDGF